MVQKSYMSPFLLGLQCQCHLSPQRSQARTPLCFFSFFFFSFFFSFFSFLSFFFSFFFFFFFFFYFFLCFFLLPGPHDHRRTMRMRLIVHHRIHVVHVTEIYLI